MNNKYYIETYGCQMNIYDSEIVGGQLEKLGYSKTKIIDEANLIFLNTCSIREKAEETVHNRLNNLHYLKKRNPNLLIGILGLLDDITISQASVVNELKSSKPNISKKELFKRAMTVGTDHISSLVNRLKKSKN